MRITNRRRAIDAEIHDRLYSPLKNWDHTRLLEISNAGEAKEFRLRAAKDRGAGRGHRAGTGAQTDSALIKVPL